MVLNQNVNEMEELYLSYQDALNECKSSAHLLGTYFETSPGAKYEVFTINPIPLSEIDEFRELLSTFIETKGSNKIELQLFESRFRTDNFTVVLSAARVVAGTANLSPQVNLITASLRRYVQTDGSLKYGFPVSESLILF